MSVQDLFKKIFESKCFHFLGITASASSFIAVYSMTLFDLGRTYQDQILLVSLSKPIQIEELYPEDTISFDKTFYIGFAQANPDINPEEYFIRYFPKQNRFTYSEEIGTAIIPSEGIDSINLLTLIEAISDLFNIRANAQTARFVWHGYEDNFRFTEKHVERRRIRRTYSSGAILEYNINSEGVSIVSSFVWVKAPTSR